MFWETRLRIIKEDFPIIRGAPPKWIAPRHFTISWFSAKIIVRKHYSTYSFGNHTARPSCSLGQVLRTDQRAWAYDSNSARAESLPSVKGMETQRSTEEMDVCKPHPRPRPSAALERTRLRNRQAFSCMSMTPYYFQRTHKHLLI